MRRSTALRMAAGKRGSASWWLAGGISPSHAVAAWQAKGASSLAASYVNLANPGTLDLSVGSAPTLGASGWDFSGGNHYLMTGVLPNATHTMVYMFAGCANGEIPAGSDKFASLAYWYGSHYLQWGGQSTAVAGNIASAVIAVSNRSGYVDGSFATTIPLTTPTGAEMWIGASSRIGGANWFNGTFVGAAYYDTELSADEVAAISLALGAL